MIDYDLDYGYKRTDLSTRAGYGVTGLKYDVLIQDYSRGDSYTSNPLGRDGAQLRTYFITQGDVTDGQSDSEGIFYRGVWHPNIMLFTDGGPLTVKRRFASIFFGNNGVVNWGIGQGTKNIDPDGTDRDDVLSDFKIVGTPEGSNLTNLFIISKATGRMGWNIKDPLYDFHMVCSKNSTSTSGTLTIENSKTGNTQIILKGKTKNRRIICNESTGDLQIVSAGGAANFSIRDDGSITLGSKQILHGSGDPVTNSVTANSGSIYLDDSATSGGTWIKHSNTTNDWIELGVTPNGDTPSRPVTTQVGYQYFDTTLGKPIYLKSTGVWVDATGTEV